MPRVLVVDDEFGIAEVLEDILTDVGHQVSIAINGRIGLQRLEDSMPDAVFLDYMMPLLDGAGMLAAMRADPRWTRIPVILMSSLPQASVEQVATGHDAFMRKPFRVATVLHTLAQVLRNKA